MKMIVAVALALVAVASALPAEERPSVPKIISQDNDQNENGYNFRYQTEDGITRNEEGVYKEVLDEENKPHQVVGVRGSFSYTDNEGNVETITYVADENGYHAEGPSVPKVSRR